MSGEGLTIGHRLRACDLVLWDGLSGLWLVTDKGGIGDGLSMGSGHGDGLDGFECRIVDRWGRAVGGGADKCFAIGRSCWRST